MSAFPVVYLGGAAASAPMIVSGGNTVVDYSGGSVRVVIQGGALTALGTVATHAVGEFQPIHANLTALAGNTSTSLALGNISPTFATTTVTALLSGSATASLTMAIAGGNALTLGSQFGSTLLEPHWRLDFAGGNVSTFRNVNVAGSSAVSFRDYLNVAKLTIGHGNDGVSGNRAGSPFVEFAGGSLRLIDSTNTKYWTLGTDSSSGMTVNELLLSVPTGQADNVLALRNDDDTQGRIAGLTLRAANNAEHGAFGRGNRGSSTVIYPFTSTVFIETSNIFGVSGPTVSDDFALIQTYRDGGNAIVWNERMRVVDRGTFTIFKNGAWPANDSAFEIKADGTVMYLQKVSGQVIIGPPNLSFPPNAAIAFQVGRGVSTSALLQVLQDGVAGFDIGYATATSENVTFGSDSNTYAISFRRGLTSAGGGGVEVLGIDFTTSQVAVTGTILARVAVTPSPSTPVTVAFGDSRKLFTNEGASAQITFNLPTAIANFQYSFYVQDADGIKVVANTGDTIRVAGSVSASAGNIVNNTIGGAISLAAINGTEWVATSFVGTWVVT